MDDVLKGMTPDQIRAVVLSLLLVKLQPPEGVTFTTEELHAYANGPNRHLIVQLVDNGILVRLMTAEDAMWLKMAGTLPEVGHG